VPPLRLAGVLIAMLDLTRRVFAELELRLPPQEES